MYKYFNPRVIIEVIIPVGFKIHFRKINFSQQWPENAELVPYHNQQNVWIIVNCTFSKLNEISIRNVLDLIV